MFLTYENKDRKHQVKSGPWNSSVKKDLLPPSQGEADQEGSKGGGLFNPHLKGQERERRLLRWCSPVTEEQGWQQEGGSRKAVCAWTAKRVLHRRGKPYRQGKEVTVSSSRLADALGPATRPFPTPSCSPAGLNTASPLPCVPSLFLSPRSNSSPSQCELFI